jgi:hypothetical protein
MTKSKSLLTNCRGYPSPYHRKGFSTLHQSPPHPRGLIDIQQETEKQFERDHESEGEYNAEDSRNEQSDDSHDDRSDNGYSDQHGIRVKQV